VRYACTVAELKAGGGMRPVVLGAREVLVVGTSEGIRVVDRACPHEGYRLDDGEVRGQELTCPAHGWRFDLRSGACVTAGEDTRTYAVDVRDGAIFVDVDVEPTAQELGLASEAVLGALETGRGSLAARRTARLLGLGERPERVALLLARYGGSHADAGLDPETAAVADALALVPHLDERAIALVFADLAAALAARLARASPRFGPAPATAFAWSDAGVRGTLAALVDGGDADECEAVVAGMLGAGVPVGDIAAGLAEGTARTFRGPWPLVVLERAVRLAAQLGPDAARVVLPVAAYGCAAGSEVPHAFAVTSDALAGAPRTPDEVVHECGRALLQFRLRSDDEPEGTGSLLGCGLALAHAAAAEWALGHTAVAAASLLHARSLAGVYAGAAAEATGDPVATDNAAIAAAVAAGPAQTPRGIAVCLAAAGAALARPDSTVRAGVLRLLETPRRERFTARELQPGFVAI
jgi:nitrite reductase/ring-hydroxylating ferredoxin subunit